MTGLSTVLRLTDGTEYKGRLRFDDDEKPIVDMTKCGTCGFEWNDALITELTPAPSGRCPNEYNHEPQALAPAWRKKAERIIGQLCRVSYERENRMRNGKLRKRHRPYSVPETAERLIKALAENDEETAKSIFVHNYDVQQLKE